MTLEQKATWAPGENRARWGVGLLVGALACGGSTNPAAAPDGAAASPRLPPPDRKTLPEAGPAPEWVPPEPTSWKLAGGATVLHRQHGAVPLVSVTLIFAQGASSDPVGKAGLTELTGDLLDEGAGDLDALQLNERLQSLATDFHANATLDGLVLSMNTIAENFAPSIDLLADIALRPRLAVEDFERRKAQHVAEALQSEADPHSGRRQAMYRALFGTGYAGSTSDGTRHTLSTITHADVKRHYASLVVGEGTTIVVTGGIDRETVERELGRTFGGLSGAPGLEKVKLTDAADTGKLYVVDYPGAPQSVIGLVRRAPGVEADDLFEADVFNRSFGSSFASRVNLNLREDKGYTYGAFSLFQRFREAGFFGIFADVRTDVTRESVSEVLRELSEVCGERPLTAEERNTSVGGLLLGYPGTFESIDRLASRFADLAVTGRPLDWYSRWPGRVAEVTLERANAAARRYCDKSEFTLVVAGDASVVAEGLAELGFQRVDVDAAGRPL